MNKDYEIKIEGKDIDVNEIMNKIRKRIEERRAKGMLSDKEIEKIEGAELKPWADHMEIMNFYEQHIFPELELKKKDEESYKEISKIEYNRIESPESLSKEEFEKRGEAEMQVQGPKGIKNMFKKIFRIFSPLITRLIMFYMRPFFLALQNGIESLQSALHDNVSSITHSIEQSRVDLQRHLEYIKLLHNLTNNMVVEISKLKVEVDSLRNRIITLENKVELVEKRERVLEDKVKD